MTYTKSNIIQYNEYYPFGLQTQSSWTRENVTSNNFLYNGGTELNATTNVYDLFFRNYDPALGRMNQVDPLAAKYASLTPYNFALNNPASLNDPLGDDVEPPPPQEYLEYICGQCWRDERGMRMYMAATGYGGGISAFSMLMVRVQMYEDASSMSLQEYGEKYGLTIHFNKGTEVHHHYNGYLKVDHNRKELTIGQTFFVETEGNTKVTKQALKKLNRIDKKLNNQGFISDVAGYEGYHIKFSIKFVAGGSQKNIQRILSYYLKIQFLIDPLGVRYGLSRSPKAFYVESSQERGNLFNPIRIENGMEIHRGGVTLSTGSIIMNRAFFYNERFIMHELFHSLGLRNPISPNDHSIASIERGVFANQMPTQADVNYLLRMIIYYWIDK